MKRKWNNPSIKNLKLEQTESSHYPLHYHCAQCGRVLSDTEYDLVQAEMNSDDPTWKCPICGGASFGTVCADPSHLVSQTS